MRVLVTGGAGFIGSHTVDLLLAEGFRVRILDNLEPPAHHRGEIPGYVPLARVDFLRGDVRDKAAWQQALQDIDAVIHLAAHQDYLPDFSTFFHSNTVGTALLYEVIVEQRLPVKKVVIASSQAVYGEGRYRCHTCRAVRSPMPRTEGQLRRGFWNLACDQCHQAMQWLPAEESGPNPHNQYSLSKLTQEMIGLNLGQRYEIPTTCLRYSIVQGARQSFRNAYSGILRIFVQRLLHHLPPVCYEDGMQLRDYVSVRDVTRANLLALADARTDWQSLNVGGDRALTVGDYARQIAARASVAIEPEIPGLYRFGDTRHSISDVSRLRKFGWRPRVPLEAIIDEYIHWARRQDGFRDHYGEAQRRMMALGAIRQATDCQLHSQGLS
jgi:dTDP-L-rhamnose 4-epimerase